MKKNKYYFLGICGTAMGSAATALKRAGYEVSGSDTGMYPPMSTVLRNACIKLFEGFNSSRINEDLGTVVVGNAMTRGNVEVEALLESGKEFISLPELIRREFIGEKKTIVVTCTHGKSTTTTLLAWILHYCGVRPGYMIGGVPNDLEFSCNAGDGDIFVIEGDEYDSAFFDKRSKFLHYKPDTVILNNMELDHVDIFFNLEDIIRTFRHLIAIVPQSGTLIANCDDENIMRLIREHPVTSGNLVKVIKYGKNPDADFRIEQSSGNGESVTIRHKKEEFNVKSMLTGSFQAYNIAAAFIAASRYGMKPEKISEAINQFSGLQRRMQERGTVNGVTVVDDFAHHPTAIKGSLEGASEKYRNGKLWVVLEPRSNTMRRRVFESRIVDALRLADRVILACVFKSGAIPEHDRLSPERVVKGLIGIGIAAKYIEEIDDIVSELTENLKDGDVVIGMSNGGFGGFYDKLINALNASK